MGLPEMPGDTPDVVWDILEYVLRHPDAVDNLHGIVRWRLLDQIIWRELKNATKAVDWLLKEGFLVETTSAATGSLFKLNHQKAADARALLTRHKGNRSS